MGVIRSVVMPSPNRQKLDMNLKWYGRGGEEKKRRMNSGWNRTESELILGYKSWRYCQSEGYYINIYSAYGPWWCVRCYSRIEPRTNVKISIVFRILDLTSIRFKCMYLSWLPVLHSCVLGVWKIGSKTVLNGQNVILVLWKMWTVDRNAKNELWLQSNLGAHEMKLAQIHKELDSLLKINLPAPCL